LILVRDAARRVVQPRFRWPRRFRGKWLALALFAAVLFTYELFDLWELPRATAWLVLGYFGAALIVDGLFAGASFCKYVCPVGQFNFAASLMSPAELQVRDIATCRSCRTSDCIKGSPATPAHGRRRGCELGLFLPMKVGNMDCTLCLDCVRACPHDNIGLMTRVPGAELLAAQRRSGIGRLAQRPDLAALAVVFTFGALLNAFAMTAAVAGVERRLSAVLSAGSEAPVLATLFLGTLVALPVLLLSGASTMTHLLAGRERLPVRATAIRYAYALVPLGFGVWLAHYAFHFLTGMLTAVPVVQSAAIDLAGWPALGEPLWRWAGMSPGSVFPIQLGFVVLGAAGSLGLARAISARDYPGRAWPASAPWLALIAALAGAGLWILAQPMDMRGVGAIG
jgi:ferredoxin